jgi:hypothetical protein
MFRGEIPVENKVQFSEQKNPEISSAKADSSSKSMTFAQQ